MKKNANKENSKKVTLKAPKKLSAKKANENAIQECVKLLLEMKLNVNEMVSQVDMVMDAQENIEEVVNLNNDEYVKLLNTIRQNINYLKAPWYQRIFMSEPKNIPESRIVTRGESESQEITFEDLFPGFNQRISNDF